MIQHMLICTYTNHITIAFYSNNLMLCDMYDVCTFYAFIVMRKRSNSAYIVIVVIYCVVLK